MSTGDIAGDIAGDVDIAAIWEAIDHARMIGDDATAERLLADVQ